MEKIKKIINNSSLLVQIIVGLLILQVIFITCCMQFFEQMNYCLLFMSWYSNFCYLLYFLFLLIAARRGKKIRFNNYCFLYLMFCLMQLPLLGFFMGDYLDATIAIFKFLSNIFVFFSLFKILIKNGDKQYVNTFAISFIIGLALDVVGSYELFSSILGIILILIHIIIFIFIGLYFTAYNSHFHNLYAEDEQIIKYNVDFTKVKNYCLFMFIFIGLTLCVTHFLLNKPENEWDKLTDEEKQWITDNYGDGRYDDIQDAIDKYNEQNRNKK